MCRFSKYAFLIFSVLILLFSGCSTESKDDSTIQIKVQDSISESAEEEFEESGRITLSSRYEYASEDGILLTYTGDLFEGLEYPEITLYQDNLLIWNTLYSEASGESIELMIFDPVEEELIAESIFSCECIMAPQVIGDSVFLCDSGTGLVLQLDESLNIIQSWQLEADYLAWYVGQGGSTLYRVEDDSTLLAIDLTTGQTEFLLTDVLNLYMGLFNSDGVNLSYIDAETQLSYEVWLDFETGTIREPPFSGSFSWVICADGIWLTGLYEQGDFVRYTVGTDENGQSIVTDNGNFVLTEGGGYLLSTSDDGYKLVLYDSDGKFVSSCTVPDEDVWYVSTTCVWSDLLQGCFFISYEEEGATLLFWDLSTERKGADLELTEAGNEITNGTAVEASLYQKATELTETYGVEVLIADQCDTVYESFTAETVIDEALISSGLDILEEALLSYPEGFFEQLQYNLVRNIRICLVGTLTATDSSWGDGSYSGFTQTSGSVCEMVIDLYQLEIGTIYHEFSHMIDAKLEWDAYCRSDSLYSEELWESLNPEGFEYEYIYDGWWDWYFEEEEYTYFVDTYSMISPTEDRARIMEYAMNGSTWIITDFAPLVEKLEYYSLCIRDAFDTTGWPEVTTWEEALQ